MAIKRRFSNSAGERAFCPECGADLGALGWKPQTPVFHCEGGRALFAQMTNPHLPHHSPAPPHPPCWRCGAPMGCARCAGPLEELICRDCNVLANKAALLARGLLPGQTIADYPAHWHPDFFARGFDALVPPAPGALLRLSAALIALEGEKRRDESRD